jgi:hypothetical protein
MTERSVITAMNFLPIGDRVFVYQAAEYDVSPPGGQARGGLSYLLSNARVSPTRWLELQGTFSRGRSIDARGISEDTLGGRAVSPTALEGFLYQSIGGRVTVEVASRVRLHAGYSRDKNNRDDAPTGRVTLGGYAGNLAGSGLDVSGSDSWMNRPTGGYHSRYPALLEKRRGRGRASTAHDAPPGIGRHQRRRRGIGDGDGRTDVGRKGQGSPGSFRDQLSAEIGRRRRSC